MAAVSIELLHAYKVDLVDSSRIASHARGRPDSQFVSVDYLECSARALRCDIEGALMAVALCHRRAGSASAKEPEMQQSWRPRLNQVWGWNSPSP